MDSSDDDYEQGKIERMQLAKALQFKVGTLCRQEEDQEHQGSTQKKNIRMSQSAIIALTELTYHYATKCLGPDLIQFSQHANRKTITVDDVKLAARRNPNGALDSLQNFCENHQDQINNKDGIKHRSKKRYRTSSSLNANLIDRQYDISDSDDEKSDSDASLGVGPSSENIGRTGSHDIKFDLQIHSSSSSSSDSGSNDGDDNEKHESDNDQIQSNVLSTGKKSSGGMEYQGTSSIHNGTSVLDDSDSDVELRMKPNNANYCSKDASTKKDDEYIELLDSD